ncbi:MAG: SDR family oxidoreductase [Desulfobacterales bacterium]|nr:SDR family oxidoreductase [Desulfobacterales bacterium]
MQPSDLSRPILVTGATGYVGGRLVPRLLAAGNRVRAAGRSLEKLNCRPWARHRMVETVCADALDPGAMAAAAKGCRVAFYLVHSMAARKGAFAEADRRAALVMAAAATAAGLERIIYLGGLGEVSDGALSRHLKSRFEVEAILKAGPVPVTILRAAMILGSGSASFEMLRYLVERLPVMTPPRWVDTPCQPIAIADVLHYLAGCLTHPATVGNTFDIGGDDVLTYRDLIQIYAETAGLPRRLILAVPVLTPRLSAQWIHLVTPVPAALAQPLAEGLAVPVVCREHRIRELIPLRPTPCREAIGTALERVAQERIDTCWSDAGAMAPPEWAACGDADYAGGTVLSCGYRCRIQTTQEEAWKAVSRIGGKNGWYFGQWLWRLRGMADRLAGGVGLGRGRRETGTLRAGDALDFYRILEVEPGRRLLLLAEMRMPGEALMEFRVTPAGEGGVDLALLARFLPLGLAGLAYWYALFPFHEWIFSGMLRNMARSMGRPITAGPERFAAFDGDACAIS